MLVTVVFSSFGNTTTTISFLGSSMTLALGIMDITKHSILIHLLQANKLGLGTNGLTESVLLNFIILSKRFANLLCILLVDLLLAKQLDSLCDKLDGQLDIHFCSGRDNFYLA